MTEAAARWPGPIQRGDVVEFRVGGGLVSWRSGVAEETVLYGVGARFQCYTVRDEAGRLHTELGAAMVRLPRRAAAPAARRERRPVREHKRAERGPARDEGYLDYVRALPCLLCAKPGPSDPHHYGPRGLGQKTDDYRVVPLCRGCHDGLHAQPSGAHRAVLLAAQVDLLVRWLRLRGTS